MAYLPLALPPGIFRNGTEYQSKGRYYDGNLVRFLKGTLCPIGGWRKKTRSGTLTDPFTASNGSHAVTVAHTAHGLRVGDSIEFPAVGSAVGGLTMTGSWTVASVPDADSYTFTHTSAATSGAGPGGGSVAYNYMQPVSGKARAITTWQANDGTTYGAVGTHTNVYAVSRTGQLFDITPVGFTAGRADAVTGGGYGFGAYGVGAYGTPRADATIIQDATVLSLAQFGQYLNFISPEDGTAYEWQLDTSSAATAISNAPSGQSLFVTNEGMLCILNGRNAAWSDQRNNTVWTPDATNQAGAFDLETPGKLMMGRRIRDAHLVWTNLDVHLMTATHDILVYTFTKLADGCGAISRNCAGVLPNATVWMSTNGFFGYNGFVQPLPCEVHDYVFSDINSLQQSKVTCFVNAQFGEVTWHYPSSGSNENDRYVTWNYRSFYEEGKVIWTIGSLVRLCGVDKGAMNYPWLVDAAGFIQEHEVGWNYDGAQPFAETGPIELGNGDNVMYADEFIPDEATQGQIQVTFKTKFFPNDAETVSAPYQMANPTWVNFCGRQMKVRYTGIANDNWRVGVPKINLKQGGRR